MQKGHIGVYEFCRRTGRDIAAVYKLIYKGTIPAQKAGSGKRQVWQIAESEVSTWKHRSGSAE